MAYHKSERPHRSLNNEPLGGLPPAEEPAVIALADVRCAEKLDGLLTHYYRRAARAARAAPRVPIAHATIRYGEAPRRPPSRSARHIAWSLPVRHGHTAELDRSPRTAPA